MRKNIVTLSLLVVIGSLLFACQPGGNTNTNTPGPNTNTPAPNTNASAPTVEPVLIKATFFSHTNDDNKDHDTGIYVKVKTSDGASLIAHADNRDNSGDDGTEYKDGSDHQFDLDLDTPGLAKSTATSFKVQVCQRTHGNDTWKFNGRVILAFSDKTNLAASRDRIELKNDGACADF